MHALHLLQSTDLQNSNHLHRKRLLGWTPWDLKRITARELYMYCMSFLLQNQWLDFY